MSTALGNDEFKQILPDKGWLWPLIICLVLMIMNWGLEALKWQVLVKSTQPLNFIQAFGSVLAGLATGLITPNRIGNFIGRNAYV